MTARMRGPVVIIGSTCLYVVVNYLKMWYVVNQNIKLTVVPAGNKSN